MNSKLGLIIFGRKTTKRCRQDESNMFILTTSSQMPNGLNQMDEENRSTMFQPNVKDWNESYKGLKSKRKGWFDIRYV